MKYSGKCIGGVYDGRHIVMEKDWFDVQIVNRLPDVRNIRKYEPLAQPERMSMTYVHNTAGEVGYWTPAEQLPQETMRLLLTAYPEKRSHVG